MVWPNNFTLSICSRAIHIHVHKILVEVMLTAALFIIFSKWKQTKYLLIEEEANRGVVI